MIQVGEWGPGVSTLTFAKGGSFSNSIALKHSDGDTFEVVGSYAVRESTIRFESHGYSNSKPPYREMEIVFLADSVLTVRYGQETTTFRKKRTGPTR